MIYYVSIRAHVLDDKSSETDVFCDFGLSTILYYVHNCNLYIYIVKYTSDETEFFSL